MAWGWLILVILAMIASIAFIAQDMASLTPPAAPLALGDNVNAAQQFILYRNAVIAYVIDHNSSAPLNALQPYLAKNSLGKLPIDAQNIVVQNGTNFTVCIWMSAPGGTLSQLENQLGNDMTIGLVNATNWTQPGPYGTTLPIPKGCLSTAKPANGDIFSVVEIGN